MSRDRRRAGQRTRHVVVVREGASPDEGELGRLVRSRRLPAHPRWYAAPDPAARRTALLAGGEGAQSVAGLEDGAEVEGTARRLMEQHPEDDLVLVLPAIAMGLLVAALTGGEQPGSGDAVVVRIRAAPGRGPVPGRKFLAMVATVMLGELLVWLGTRRLGLAAGAAAVAGVLLMVPTRTRRTGMALVAAAAVGLFLAALGLVGAVRMPVN